MTIRFRAASVGIGGPRLSGSSRRQAAASTRDSNLKAMKAFKDGNGLYQQKD